MATVRRGAALRNGFVESEPRNRGFPVQEELSFAASESLAALSTRENCSRKSRKATHQRSMHVERAQHSGETYKDCLFVWPPLWLRSPTRALAPHSGSSFTLFLRSPAYRCAKKAQTVNKHTEARPKLADARILYDHSQAKMTNLRPIFHPLRPPIGWCTVVLVDSPVYKSNEQHARPRPSRSVRTVDIALSRRTPACSLHDILYGFEPSKFMRISCGVHLVNSRKSFIRASKLFGDRTSVVGQFKRTMFVSFRRSQTSKILRPSSGVFLNTNRLTEGLQVDRRTS